MAIQGIAAIQDERDIVPYLTAQALTPCQVGGATLEKCAFKPAGTA
jgi:hypothetical protein